MKKWWSNNGLFVFAIVMLAAATLVQEKAKAEEKPKENPLRSEVFTITNATGREERILRIYDTETGFVCYRSSWSDNTARMGDCKEVKRSRSINQRYGAE